MFYKPIDPSAAPLKNVSNVTTSAPAAATGTTEKKDKKQKQPQQENKKQPSAKSELFKFKQMHNANIKHV